ncbi:tetratricopeptide repeat-containing sulfotransferase family protein [Dasania marina]|uniref:tetratricopeptide repeat-containing sulfotransferase family protein n=1 Tax=Dasania marina TaxID=471499 RepID=UPI00037C95B8|nr:tetratricopeptide repeat-containing sulfotransferase family protein [Dasania marina]
MTTQIKMNEQQTLQKLLKQGFEALKRGEIREASAYCQQILHIQPDLVQGHFLVGLVALEAKDRKMAYHAFGSVTKLQKDHTAAWAQLARLYMSEGQVNMADNALTEATKHSTQDPMILDVLGAVYSRIDEHQKSAECFKKAYELAPTNPSYMLNYANNMIFRGEIEQGAKLLEEVFNVDINNPQAHWTLSGAKKAKNTEHIEVMQSQLKKHQGKLHPRAIAYYQYAVGKESEDLQLWDQAINSINIAAKARRATIEYDERSEIEAFDFLEQEYTREWFDNLEDGNPDPSPIFVLGQPRTGTTLVERIITSHSQVHSAGELQQFALSVRRLGKLDDPRRYSKKLFEKAMRLSPKQLGSMYLHTTQKLTGDSPRFVDKLPLNYLMLPLILKALPNAKIIHLTRNPMDACFASYKQLFGDAYMHSYDQAEMARHHARYRRLMDVWRERFPGQFFDISYESTASDLEPNARALINFLELPWEDACLHFHEQKAAVSTASSVQVREPAHTRSIGRWKRYEQQLSTMMSTLHEQGVPIDN